MLKGTLCKDIDKEVFKRKLCTDLVHRAVIEVVYIDLAKRSLTEMLPREFLKIEILYRDLAHRSLIELLPRDLPKGACTRSCEETW